MYVDLELREVTEKLRSPEKVKHFIDISKEELPPGAERPPSTDEASGSKTDGTTPPPGLQVIPVVPAPAGPSSSSAVPAAPSAAPTGPAPRPLTSQRMRRASTLRAAARRDSSSSTRRRQLLLAIAFCVFRSADSGVIRIVTLSGRLAWAAACVCLCVCVCNRFIV